jgi:hypothetical protein
MNIYAIEKTTQLERELRNRRPLLPPEEPKRKTIFGPIAARAGRALRRAGEGLEGWANVPITEDHQVARRAP